MSLYRWVAQASGALVVLASAYCAQKAVDEALQQRPELSDDSLKQPVWVRRLRVPLSSAVWWIKAYKRFLNPNYRDGPLVLLTPS